MPLPRVCNSRLKKLGTLINVEAVGGIAGSSISSSHAWLRLSGGAVYGADSWRRIKEDKGRLKRPETSIYQLQLSPALARQGLPGSLYMRVARITPAAFAMPCRASGRINAWQDSLLESAGIMSV